MLDALLPTTSPYTPPSVLGVDLDLTGVVALAVLCVALGPSTGLPHPLRRSRIWGVVPSGGGSAFGQCLAAPGVLTAVVMGVLAMRHRRVAWWVRAVAPGAVWITALLAVHGLWDVWFAGVLVGPALF